MIDPLFWLGLSILLVAASLTAVLVAALPAFRELARAARSAEKLFDTLSRELPPTLEAIRLTGLEITDLKEDVSEGVQSAGRVVQQVDQSVSGAKNQVQQAQNQARSFLAGAKAAWSAFNRPVESRPVENRPTESWHSKNRHSEGRGAVSPSRSGNYYLEERDLEDDASGLEDREAIYEKVYEEAEREGYMSQKPVLSQNLESSQNLGDF